MLIGQDAYLTRLFIPTPPWIWLDRDISCLLSKENFLSLNHTSVWLVKATRAALALRIKRKTHRDIVSMKGAATKLTNVTSYRVIYGDTDQMGVVYYANYLQWFERGRSEFLRQLGLPYSTIEQAGFHFPVAEVACRYANPARYDDVIQIDTELSELGRASLFFTYRVSRPSDKCLLATGSTKHACVDRSGRVARIPKILTDAIDAASR
jgi:acyl-CoA thioester hydrolase